MSMKIRNICLTVLITGACALSAHAQKQLKYVPQALKGAKAVPYVVKPQFSVRAQFVVPVVRPQGVVVRPNVSATVERQVAAKVTVQERLARLEKNLKALEEYARTHGNSLPTTIGHDEFAVARRKAFTDIIVLKKFNIVPTDHPLFQRYNQLLEAEKALQPTPQERVSRLEANLALLEEYVLVHKNQLPPANVDTEEANVRKQVIADISVLKREQILPKTHPLFQRYNQLIEVSEQQLKAEKQQQRLRYDEQRQKAILARAEQQEQEKLARAQQREQERQARAEQELREQQARAQQREQDKLAREERQRQEEQFFRELRAQELAAEQRAWRQVLLQDKAWQAQPEETLAAPVENAEKAATLVEQQLTTPQTITDDYIDQLLQFYNKLDPMGTGTIQ